MVKQSDVDALCEAVIREVGEPLMKQVAERAMEMDGLKEGYMTSVEGGKALYDRDWRATVITVTAQAARSNAKHNTLLNALGEVAGA